MDINLDQEGWLLSQTSPQLTLLGESDDNEQDSTIKVLQQLQVDYARTIARAEQHEHQVKVLYELSQNVSVTLELDDLRQSIVEAFLEGLRADTIALFLHEDKTLRIVAQCNIDLTRARIVFGMDEGLVAMAAREHRQIYVPDTSAHPNYLVTGQDMPRSLLAIPIDPQNGQGYVLCAVRRHTHAFTDDEIQFASLMGSVAAQALSNAGIYNEMCALAREQATLYELARASNASDGVATFINQVLEPVRSALSATGCTIVLIGESSHHAAQAGRTASLGMSAYGILQTTTFAEEIRQHPEAERVAVRCDAYPDGTRLILAPIIVRETPVAIVGWERRLNEESLDEGNQPAVIANPVWGNTQDLLQPLPSGLLQYHQHELPFIPLTDVETTFIASLCQQLALGIENLNLRVRDLGAFRSISALPASRPHLEHVRQAIVNEVANAFAPASVALLIRDESDQGIRIAATTRNTPNGWVQSAMKLASEGNDLRQQRGIILAPLTIEQETFGWLAMRLMGATALTPDRALVFSSLAGAAALILRNARLHIIAREAAVDRERQRIAREMHDGVAQNLAHLMMRLELVQRLVMVDPDRAIAEAGEARHVLYASLNDLRQSIAALAPAQLEEMGFAGAVQAILDDIATNSQGLRVTFTTCPDDMIPPELRATLFRVVQEALSNIRKHAQATHARIAVLVEEDQSIHLTIQDDGIGFDYDTAIQTSGHFGLRGMRERAEEFGGELQINSTSGLGTTISLRLPLSLAA